ncbi:MAG: response regulator transcription factor [Gammaproteobacteria bacterium]|jgi:DNA-binding response OmpR family regulator
MTKTNQGNILLIEDHYDIADMICEYMERSEYIMDHAADGVSGLHLAVSNDYDVIILDLMLPGMDGIEVLNKIRTEAKCSTPVLILTARDTLDDKLCGLDSGADDYLIKPFDIKELDARVRALIRREKGLVSPVNYQIADLVFDPGTMKVTRAGNNIKLTPIAMKILQILMNASPRIVSRRDIERQIWGDILPDSDTLRSHMYNLRKSIDKPYEKQLLETMQSTGYRLIDPDEN